MTERKPRKHIANVPDFHEIQQAALDALNKLPRKPSCTGLLSNPWLRGMRI